MRLGTLNVRGGSNDSLLKEIIASADLDVLCVTETHGKSDSTHHTTSKDLFIAGPPVAGPSRQHRGGVRLLAGPKGRLRYRAHLNTQEAQILVAKSSDGILIIGAYIAPLRGKSKMQSILEWIKPWLRGKAVLLGDLNARNRNWDSDTNAYGSALQAWASTHGAKVYAPPTTTCVTALGASTVDLLVAREPRLDNVSVIPGMWDYATDHRLVTAQVCPPSNNAHVNIPANVLRAKAKTREASELYLEHLPTIAHRANAATTPIQLNMAVSDLQCTLLRPWLQFCRRPPARFKMGWTRELDHMARERRRLLHQASKGKEGAKLAARILDRTIKRKQRARRRAIERRESAEEERPLNADRASELDEKVRRALNTKHNSPRPSPSAFIQHMEGSFRKDPPIQCEKFTLDANFEYTVEQAIMAIPRNRAAGPDGIPPPILQLTPGLVAECLCAIWRAVGRLQHVPVALSVGRVTPIPKKGDSRQPSNYRPICILNLVRRVMTAAIDFRIRRELSLHPRQWGFRKNIGTEHAIAHLDARRRAGFNYLAVLDLKGAYDRAPRDRIVAIAKHRLSPDLAGIITAVLGSGEVFISGEPTALLPITSGVPQGDPLSPTLFNLLMDDFLQNIDEKAGPQAHAASCYADDIALSAKSRHALQSYLNMADTWALKNGMHWNVRKCEEMIRTTNASTTPLMLTGEPIPQRVEIRYLGITINWDGVSTTSLRDRLGKALRRMTLISKSQSLENLPYDRRRYIILAHVFPLVDYACHLCPLTASTRATAALLERKASSWVLDHHIRCAQTIRGRTLARLPPLDVRRKRAAFRRIFSSEMSLSLDSSNSEAASRARLLLNNVSIRELDTDAPRPPACLSEALDNLLRSEWRRAMPGQRPIPISTNVPPTLRQLSPPLLHTVAAFYMNSIPLQKWHCIPHTNREYLKKLFRQDRITKSEQNKLKVILTHLTQNSNRNI